MRIHEYLDLVVKENGETVIRCKCGYELCTGKENYKNYSVMNERDLNDLPLRKPISGDSMFTHYQEFFCPNCGTLLEVDTICPALDTEDPILWDIQIDIKSNSSEYSDKDAMTKQTKMKRELDPIKYEVFRHRLFNILEEGRIAMKMVSGSPIVVEGGETMCSIHLGDGTPILVAAGILLHAIGARDFIYEAIKLYEEDPGINEGDQLFFNDPYIGGQHLPDMVVIRPIFYEGKRVAWVGSIMHTPETGGIQPSGQGSKSTDIFQEGIRILGLKVVEAGKFRHDVFNTIVQQVRDPHLVGLDLKARIAANNVCSSRYLQLVEKFGLSFVEAASQKIIDDAEHMARLKLRSLPDGIWRSRLYGDTSGVSEKPFKVMCTMTKKADEVCFDFTGSSAQNEGSLNSTLPAAWGSLFVVLCSQLFWDIPWNGGMMRAVKLVAPEGTVVNCKFPAATANGVSTTGCLIQETAHECVAKALFAGGLIDDVSAGWRGPVGAAPYFGGINQFGSPCAGMILDAFASGTGANANRDGVDTGGNMMNPSSMITDAEMIEMNLPFLCLGRKNAIDSGGFGKFRGGMGPEVIYAVHGTDHLLLGFSGTARRTPPNYGMFGGYPAAIQEARLALTSQLPDWFARSRKPETFEEVAALGGTIINPPNSYSGTEVKEWDIFIDRLGGGGGYGDPIERDSALVAEDVRNMVISREIAQKVYGVVLNPDTLELDELATEEERQRIRKERLSKDSSVSRG